MSLRKDTHTDARTPKVIRWCSICPDSSDNSSRWLAKGLDQIRRPCFDHVLSPISSASHTHTHTQKRTHTHTHTQEETDNVQTLTVNTRAIQRHPTCTVPVVLLRGVVLDDEAVSLLRLLSWLRQWGSGWACRALKDMEPMGWQDTERGHTGMAMVMNEMGFRILDSSGLERCEDFFL